MRGPGSTRVADFAGSGASLSEGHRCGGVRIGSHDHLPQRTRRNPLFFPANTFPKASRGGAPWANNATLLFVHVPKTAGSSMKRVLERVQDIPFFFFSVMSLFFSHHAIPLASPNDPKPYP